MLRPLDFTNAFNSIDHQESSSQSPRVPRLHGNISKLRKLGRRGQPGTPEAALARVESETDGLALRTDDAQSVPAGSLEFESVEMRASVTSLGKALTKLSSVACPRSASLILRQCLGSAKVTYLLRTLRFCCRSGARHVNKPIALCALLFPWRRMLRVAPLSSISSRRRSCTPRPSRPRAGRSPPAQHRPRVPGAPRVSGWCGP